MSTCNFHFIKWSSTAFKKWKFFAQSYKFSNKINLFFCLEELKNIKTTFQAKRGNLRSKFHFDQVNNV